MVGYEKGSKAYRACNPSTNKVVVTLDVVFEEAKSWNWNSIEMVYLSSDEISTLLMMIRSVQIKVLNWIHRPRQTT